MARPKRKGNNGTPVRPDDPDKHPGQGGTSTKTTDDEKTGERDRAPMRTTASTTAPESAPADAAADESDSNMEAFFSTGPGNAVHYHREGQAGPEEASGGA